MNVSATARTVIDSLGFGAGYLLNKGERDHDDHDVVRELGRSSLDDVLPHGLGLRWLGVAGYELTYDGYTILIDPYVTRLSLNDFLLRRVVRPAEELIGSWTDRADAILVGHTHFDHGLDVPVIARRTAAPVYGSASMATLMRLHGLGSQAVIAEPYLVHELGPFRITFVPRRHARLTLGLSVPMSGEITCESRDRMMPQAYRCGQVWGIHIEVAGFTIYHQSSADLADDAVRHTDIDLFLCCVAGRQCSPRYVERVLTALRPNVVVPMHYDDFMRPLDEPMSFTFDVNLTGFVNEVADVSRDIELRTLPMARPG